MASLIGLTVGTSTNNTAGWLHVSIDGKELYIAKKNVKNYVSWEDLNSLNALTGKVVSFNGRSYKVRVLKGAKNNPINEGIGYDVSSTHGSEWNRIMYRLHDGAHTNTNNKTDSEEPLSRLANYSDSDLDLLTRYSISQETYGTTLSASYKVIRGYYGVSYLSTGSVASTYRGPTIGWRPVLEVIN